MEQQYKHNCCGYLLRIGYGDELSLTVVEIWMNGDLGGEDILIIEYNTNVYKQGNILSCTSLKDLKPGSNCSKESPGLPSTVIYLQE